VTSPTNPRLAPAGPARQQRSIQLPQLLLSLLVVAVFALLAVWWQASTNSRTATLALANNVEQGQPISASDLTEIYVSSDVPARVQDATDASIFLGARPVTDLSAGTLITTEMFVAGAELADGQAFVGLVLDPTRAPQGIQVGDRVQVLGPSRIGEPAQILSSDARVQNAEYQNRQLYVRLRLDLTSAQTVQVLAEQVALIEVENSGLAPWEGEDPS